MLNDLSRLLGNVALACWDDETRDVAVGLGSPLVFKAEDTSFQSVIAAIASRFSS
jgi:hypothetical protein